MRDRKLVAATKGWGQPVNRIQRMPKPQPRNLDQSLAAVTRVPPLAGMHGAAG
jgi:dihydroorotase